MQVEQHPDAVAVLLRPEAGVDRPEDLEDAIDDALTNMRHDPDVPAAKVAILDFSELGEREIGPWMKAVGPAVPDVNLRFVVSEKLLVVARTLGLTAFFEWYDSVDAALRGGV